MRQNDLAFANFILRFGIEEVMLDYAEEIVIPAFTNRANVRTYGDTNYRFHDVYLTKIAEEDGEPIITLSGHFVKDTILRRQQVFRPDRGIVEDSAEIESAPSSFFILILNNHRLLYFAETANAPTLDNFSVTSQSFLREEYRRYLRDEKGNINITRIGPERLSLSDLKRRLPPPVLTVVPVAGQDLIEEIVARFGKIKEVRFSLNEPNDEIDASQAVAAVEEAFRPMRPKRLELVASDPQGLDKDEAARAITEVSEGQNTNVTINGTDVAGLRMKAQDDEFALTTPISDPPHDDLSLRKLLFNTYTNLVGEGKVRRLPTTDKAIAKIRQLLSLT